MILNDYTMSFLAEDRQRGLRAEAAENGLARLSREGRPSTGERRRWWQRVSAGLAGLRLYQGRSAGRSEGRPVGRSAGRSPGRSGTVSLRPGHAHR